MIICKHAVQVGFDHPVVMEWSKAYETVIKFKENLVDLLSQAPGQLPAMADDLRTLELHSLDRSSDVQGQITEMRFSLALMLHQIEQTLQDTFAEAVGTTDSEETGIYLQCVSSPLPLSTPPHTHAHTHTSLLMVENRKQHIELVTLSPHANRLA